MSAMAVDEAPASTSDSSSMSVLPADNDGDYYQVSQACWGLQQVVCASRSFGERCRPCPFGDFLESRDAVASMERSRQGMRLKKSFVCQRCETDRSRFFCKATCRLGWECHVLTSRLKRGHFLIRREREGEKEEARVFATVVRGGLVMRLMCLL